MGVQDSVSTTVFLHSATERPVAGRLRTPIRGRQLDLGVVHRFSLDWPDESVSCSGT